MTTADQLREHERLDREISEQLHRLTRERILNREASLRLRQSMTWEEWREYEELVRAN